MTCNLVVFPALAGINRALAASLRNAIRVPRASGDKPNYALAAQIVEQCSPR